MTRVYVPCDSVAIALGADRIADDIRRSASRRGLDVQIVRNGSRCMFFLEPLIEVATPGGRIGYGPVASGDVESLFASDFLAGGAHPLRIGRPDDHPFLKGQTRLTFARNGLADPLSLADYQALDGGRGLARALEIGPQATRA